MKRTTKPAARRERATAPSDITRQTTDRLDRPADLTHQSPSDLAPAETLVAAVKEGIAEADAGKLIPHAAATAYLRSVASGTPRKAPKPRRARH